MKKIIQCSLLIFLMAPVFCAPATQNIRFPDVPNNHWAAGYVYRSVNQLRVLKGYPDGLFRGDQAITRYETAMYINNLSLLMQEMMDQKLRTFSAPSGFSVTPDRSLQNLQREMAELRAELRAMQGRETVKLDLPILIEDALFIDIYTRSYKIHPHYDFDVPNPQSLVPQVTFRLGREFGLNGYRFELYEEHTSIKGWAGQWFTPDIWWQIYGSLGPGQRISRLDYRVSEHPGNTMGFIFDFWGLQLGGEHTYIGEANVSYFAEQPQLVTENREINRTTGIIKYKTPALPILGTVLLSYAVDDYYTVPLARYEDNSLRYDLQTMRYRTGVCFEPADLISLQTNAVKESQSFYAPGAAGVTDNSNNKKRPAQYYDVAIEVGDVFRSGTSWKIMYAYKDTYFGENNLRENVPGINLLDYAACGYFAGRMPSANMVSETGIKLSQTLFHPYLFADLIYVYGQGYADEKIAAESGLLYKYTQQAVVLNWRIRQNGLVYLAYEQADLWDKSVELDRNQYYEVINKFGIKLNF